MLNSFGVAVVLVDLDPDPDISNVSSVSSIGVWLPGPSSVSVVYSEKASGSLQVSNRSGFAVVSNASVGTESKEG